MSAERGWIGDPQPSVEWRDSHYSRQADRVTSRDTSSRSDAQLRAELAAEFGYYPATTDEADIERHRRLNAAPGPQITARTGGITWARPRRRPKSKTALSL